MSDDEFLAWFERTWSERQDEFVSRFGHSHPAGSPEGYVICCEDSEVRMEVPGACCMVFPPIDDGHRVARETWLYLTHGLTQPHSPEAVEDARREGLKASGYGCEFGIVVDEADEWVASALINLLRYHAEGSRIGWGDRFLFGFYQQAGVLSSFTGTADELGVTAVGETAAMLFLPYLFPNADVTTSTGNADIVIGTTITRKELEMARGTTSEHVLLLLCRAGIGQRSIPMRSCLADDERWRNEWEEISAMRPEAVHTELVTNVDRWHSQCHH